MRTIDEILKVVCIFLDEHEIDYVIVGGFAVLFYGNPRTTMDIDYVIQLVEENIPELIKFLQDNSFHADEYDMRTAIKERSHCTVEDKETMFRLDIREFTAKWMKGRSGTRRKLRSTILRYG